MRPHADSVTKVLPFGSRWALPMNWVKKFSGGESRYCQVTARLPRSTSITRD